MRPRFLPILVLFLVPASANAYIERLYSLEEVLEESTNIVVGRIESVDLRRRTVVATIERTLKGRKEYERIQMDIGAGPPQQGTFVLELLDEGDPFIFYYARDYRAPKGLVHSGNYWFQLFGEGYSDARNMWWRFTHIEIYFPRTYDGSTPDLIELTRDALSGKRHPPRANPRAQTINPRRLDVREARRLKRGSSSDPDSGPVTLVKAIATGSKWTYHKGRRAPSAGSIWQRSDFDESDWASGRAPFGYGDPERPVRTRLTDMLGTGDEPGYSTLYLRQRFVLPPGAAVRGATCRADYDDGFILWINGQRVVGANAPDGSPRHDAVAKSSHESGKIETFDLADTGKLFAPGENIAAVQVLNRVWTSSDLRFDLELEVTVEKRTGPEEAPAETGRFTPLVRIAASPAGEKRGISWVDLNGDELLDVYFCRAQGDVLLENEGDSFTRAAGAGVSGGSRSAGWADWDGDDHPDLLTNNFQLFSNDSGRLRLVALQAPGARNSEGAGWIDYNGDGRPDILVTNGEHGILLWENTGDAGQPFRDVSLQAGLGPSGVGARNGDFVVFSDFDGDGYTDFFYNVERGLLAHNEGDGTFTADPSSGIALEGGPDFKRGLAAGDFDRDGDVDLFVPDPRRPALYRNENDGTFRNVIDAAGDLSRMKAASVTAAWGDANNDGHLDLVVVYASGASGLYLGDGGGLFHDATREVGLHEVPRAHAASFADVDADGDLDLAFNLEDGVAIYRNGVKKPPRRTGLEVRLHVPRGRIGSTVRVLDDEGRLLGLRQPASADGCGGQQSPLAHIAVPQSSCRISVVLGDGRFAEKTIEAKGSRTAVTFRVSDFE